MFFPSRVLSCRFQVAGRQSEGLASIPGPPIADPAYLSNADPVQFIVSVSLNYITLH